MRLGIYSDLVYRADADVLSTHQAFIRFVTALVAHVDEIVLFGRLDPQPGRSHYPLPSERVRFVPLPHYPAVTALGGQARALRGTLRAFAAELPRLDAVWIFGPHPMAVALALAARRRRTTLFLGVRQDYPEYIRNRLPGPAWGWTIPVAHALELVFRRLARDAPTVVLGDELARKYRASGARAVLSTGFSLIGAGELASREEALARNWDGELEVLTVGRLAREKNPLLLPEIVRELRAHGGRWRLVVVGDGPLAAALVRRAEELGVSAAMELAGYVPSGPALASLYRRSHVFLHVSLTEGLPQVLWEAQAAGLPVVATDVGGVRGALGGGSGLLVPPGDAGAAARALARIRDDPALRTALVEQGLDNAAAETTEAQLARIAAFFRAARER